jgi:hypothetical protein
MELKIDLCFMRRLIILGTSPPQIPYIFLGIMVGHSQLDLYFDINFRHTVVSSKAKDSLFVL